MNDYRDAEASRLTIDYRNAMAAAVGPEHGVTDAMLDEMAPVVAEQHARLSAEHAAGGQRWMDLPSDTALAAEIDTFAAEARAQYRDFILVGIGGSSLGAIATVQALAHPFRNLLPSAGARRTAVLRSRQSRSGEGRGDPGDGGSGEHTRQRRDQVGANGGDDGELSRRAAGARGGRRTRASTPADRGHHGSG